MADEERESRGFTVVDRRHGREEESTREVAAGGPAPAAETAPETAAEAAAEAGASEPPPEGGRGPGFTLVGEPHEAEQPAAAEDALPPVDLSSLALSFATSALYHLGLVADPQTGEQGPVDLRLARHSIDTIELLQEKTRGNTSDEEARLLANLLTELRMRFVEAGRQG